MLGKTINYEIENDIKEEKVKFVKKIMRSKKNNIINLQKQIDDLTKEKEEKETEYEKMKDMHVTEIYNKYTHFVDGFSYNIPTYSTIIFSQED